MLLTTTLKRSNLSLNQREDPVILPNPNHQDLDCQNYVKHPYNQITTNQRFVKSSQENDNAVVEIHRSNENNETLTQMKQSKECSLKTNKHVQNDNLHFDLNGKSNRISSEYDHMAASKRISSSSSGGYSATDEVDYLKWVSETKGQLKHHINQKTPVPAHILGKGNQELERAANKSLNSSSSGVSSVESCPVDNIHFPNNKSHRSKQYPSISNQKRPPSLNSSSSGHGSPEESVVESNAINSEDRICEDQMELNDKNVLQQIDKKSSPISSISRINSSSPDSGYEHISSTGNLAYDRCCIGALDIVIGKTLIKIYLNFVLFFL